MIKNVLFDFDGTLADSREVMRKVYPRVATKFGFKILSEEELEELKSYSFRERAKKVNMPLTKLPAIIKETRALCGEYMDLCVPYPGILELIADLKDRGLSLGILSSNDAGNINKFLSAYNLEVFDHVFTTSGLFGKHTVLKKYLKKEGMDKDEVLYVGDETRDIVSSKKAGIKVVAVTWGYDAPSLLRQEEPEYMVSDPREILSLV